jgi:aminopeptidase S
MRCKLFTSLCAALAVTACSSMPTTSQSSKSEMWQHLVQLEHIAKQHNNQRSVGSSGGKASGQYILDIVKTTPYTVQMLPFENRDKIVGQNIIVEIKGQNPNQAIILGAHYDSVDLSPGINDNGSGVAVLLSVLQHYAKTNTQPINTLYVAFWDSEETGIAGSNYFVKNLSQAQIQNTNAYINVDMVGTKNPTALVVDADKSSIDDLEKQLKQQGMPAKDYAPLLDGFRAIPTHAGDAKLQQVLTQYLKTKNVPIREDIATVMASDTAPFMGKVPVASVILFNERMKGNVLEFAPCYHQACDTLKHIDEKSLNIAREAVLTLIAAVEAQ